MSDATTDVESTPQKASKMPLLVGLALAVLAGAGGFYAVQSGLILGTESPEKVEATDKKKSDIAFVPIDPLTISLGPNSSSRHLRFRAQLEVNGAYEKEVAKLMPRVVDVLNGYLRAVELRDLEDPSTLIRLRAQMLRRVQIITGEGRVRDLLVMEFVLS